MKRWLVLRSPNAYGRAFAVKLYHIVALEMIPSIAIKIATSSSLSILTTCTADLVAGEKKKTLMFSAAVWARAWFLWAPFIGMVKVYGPTAPLTIFATLAVLGGVLTSVINHSNHRSHKKAQRSATAPPLPDVELAMKHIAVIEVDMMGSIKMNAKDQ